MYPEDFAREHEFGMQDDAQLYKAMATAGADAEVLAPPVPEAAILGAALVAMPDGSDDSKLTLVRRRSEASIPGLLALLEACK